MSIHNKTYKRSAFLDVLTGKQASSVPVWMMRQAGRYLPEYMKLRAKYSFFERCETPELACEITVMPIHMMPLDASIIFSDILVVPQAMGLEVQLEENKGPLLPQTIRSKADLSKIVIPDVQDRLHYVAKAIEVTTQALDSLVPLIGFAGTPWTIACYMVEGKGSKNFDIPKQLAFSDAATMHTLLQMITDTTIAYLKMQVKAGAECVQLFDSWAGALDPAAYRTFSLPYIQQIVEAMKDVCPVIVYSKGAWHSLSGLAATGATALGIDWNTPPQFAREYAGDDIVLQGNLDPAVLLSPIAEIEAKTKAMIDAFGTHNYIANLGHGILPNVQVDNAKAFVNAVKNYSVK